MSYIDLFDNLAVFDRALTDEEVGLVYRLEGASSRWASDTDWL